MTKYSLDKQYPAEEKYIQFLFWFEVGIIFVIGIFLLNKSQALWGIRLGFVILAIAVGFFGEVYLTCPVTYTRQ